MLERTAGCLESGSLRLLLPGPRLTLTSRRTLHSTFWHHGGGDLELSPLWAVLLRGPDHVDQIPENEQQKTSTGHGGMLLEFLYPAGTINFLRQYSGLGVDKRDSWRARAELGKLGHRLYTSAADGILVCKNDGVNAIVGGHRDITSEAGRPEPLQKLFGLQKGYDYEEAWRQYSLLGGSDQAGLRRELIEYFSTSKRVVDAERTTELFEQLGQEEKTREVYVSAIRAYLRLRNLSDAIALHKSALEKFEIAVGSDLLLAYMIDNSLWSHAVNIWTDFRDFNERFPKHYYNIFATLDDLPTLSVRAFELAHYVNRRIEMASASSATSSGTSSLELASRVVRRALLSRKSFDQKRFTGLLQILEQWGFATAHVYEESIWLLFGQNQTKLAVQCYRKARQNREVKLSRSMLHTVLKTFCHHHSVIGMQQVLDDFFRMYSKPTRVAYKMCMSEFAFQGDSSTVHALFEQYTGRFQFKGKPMLTADEIAPILHVHAKRGELAEVVKSFNQIQDNYGLQPTLLCWNILINAYGKVNDVDGAFACFEQLLESPDLRPDDYTFGTVMGTCASRGDLEQTVDLYRLADSLNIEKSSGMVDCLVLAYLQDERFPQAEKICEDSLKVNLKGTRTRMWNYMLLAYAMRRDLQNVNRLLRRMSEAKVDYDQYTYSALMQALSMVKQPDRAYVILQDVMREAGIMPTSFHYAVVMGGYLANGEIHKVFHVQNRMLRRGIRNSASTHLLALKSAVIEDQNLLETGTKDEQAQRAFQIFQDAVSSMNPQDMSDTARKGFGRTPFETAYPAMFYSYVMFIHSQFDKFETVNELFQRFKNTLPENRRDSPPIEILSAMMVAKMRAQDFEGVQECWDLAVKQARVQGRTVSLPNAVKRALNLAVDDSKPSSEHQKILPAHQLDLTRILTIYLTSLAKQKRVDDVPPLINGLLEDGFLLDNNNWNHYVQLITRRYHYKLAFELCENRLMDGWTGWQRIRWQLPERNRLPMEVRHLKKQPKHLRPKYHTLLYLARGYLELQSMSAESRGSQILLDELERECPRTIRAIKTMPRVDDGLEREVLRGY